MRRIAIIIAASWLNLLAASLAAQDDGTEGLPLETTRAIRFTTDEGTWLDLDVSPDGETIVLDMLGDLYTLPITGGKATRITSGQSYDAQPRYSPDGSQIVFISDRSGGENVWVANADGSEPKMISKGETNRFQSPDWTADGHIVVSKGRVDGERSPFPSRRYDQRLYDLVLYDLRGGTGLKLEVEGNNVLGAAFGSDPRYVYAAVGGTDSDAPTRFGAWSVVVFDRETGSTSTRVRRNGGAVRPVVSPDNRWLVYGTRYDHGQALRLQDLETGDEQWLLQDVQRDEQESIFSRDLMPGSAFTPDGSALILYNKGGLWRVDVPTGRSTQIPFTADVEIPAGPLARFDYRVEDDTVTVRQIRGARPSPDGTKLVFTALNELWLMELPSGTPRRLTTETEAGEHQAVWSPDGRYIAYVTWMDGEDAGGDIYRARVPAGPSAATPERLTRQRAFYTHPVYSPDGSRIVAVRSSRHARINDDSFAGDDALIWIPAAGGGATLIKDGIGSPARPGGVEPHFTADTSRIWLNSGAELSSMRWDGLDQRTMLTATGADAVVISPDGTRALALAGAGPQAYVITLPQVSGLTVELANPDDAAVPVRKATTIGAAFAGWTSDGSRFHYSLGRSFFTYDLTKPDSLATRRTDITLTVPADRPGRDRTGRTIVLRGGRIITMNGDEVIDNGHIVVTDNRIVAVGSGRGVQIPQDATVVDVSGKTVLPGYVDVHGHIGDRAFGTGGVTHNQHWRFSIMLAYGITTVRDPSTTGDIFAYMDLLDAGRMLGPRLYATGPPLQSSENITSLEDARNVVTRYADFFNTRYVKQYGTGERQVRQWLIAAAAEKEITAVTEPYYDVKKYVTDAIDGYPEMGHGWPIFPIYKDLVELMAQTGMTHTATLTTTFGGPKGRSYFFTRKNFHDDPKLRRFMPHSYIDRQALRQSNWYADEQFIFTDHAKGIKKMLDAGVNVAIGGHGDFPGLGYHWELEMHAMGGVPLHDLLRAATINGAKAIGLEEDLGSIEPGKLADLQVLDANPLESIENTRSIRYVMKNGRLYDGHTLDELTGREVEPQ